MQYQIRKKTHQLNVETWVEEVRGEKTPRIKVTNLGKEKIEMVISGRLTSLNYGTTTNKFTIHPNMWWVPSMDFTGCSFAVLHFKGSVPYWVPLPFKKEYTGDFPKVVCVGLNKTGTTSFTNSMTEIGYKFLPEIDAAVCTHEAVNGEFTNLFELIKNPRFNAYEDVPFSLPGVSEKIIEEFQDIKYVLTVRDSPLKWVNSVKRWFPKIHGSIDFLDINKQNSFPESNEFYSQDVIRSGIDEEGISLLFQTQHLKECWKIDTSNKTFDQALFDFYESYNYQTENKLKELKRDYIILDVSREGELGRLCEWLGVETNEKNFVWANKNLS